MSLSKRLRPEVEAAPWVIEEVKKLEEELDAAGMAVDLVKKENARLREALEKISHHLHLSSENIVVNAVYRSPSDGLRLAAETIENRDKAILAVRAALEGKE